MTDLLGEILFLVVKRLFVLFPFSQHFLLMLSEEGISQEEAEEETNEEEERFNHSNLQKEKRY